MIEKMNIFDVEIPILTAKEAMIRAMQYLESESVDTIELVSMDMLMKERENAQWKEQINALTMLLPENTEILKAAEIENEKLFRETEENVFLKMFMKYMQKNHKKIFLLADSEENLGKVEAVLSRHNRGIRVTGQMVISENEEQIQDAINAINGTETDCILSVLPSPFQERFITANKALLNVRVWLGGGCAFTGHLDEIKLRNRIRFFYSEENFQISCRTGKRITDLPGNKIYIRKIVNYAKSENMNFL